MANVVLDWFTNGDFATAYSAAETTAFTNAQAAIVAFTPLVDLLAEVTAARTGITIYGGDPFLRALTSAHKATLRSDLLAKLVTDGLDGHFEVVFLPASIVVRLSKAGIQQFQGFLPPNFSLTPA